MPAKCQPIIQSNKSDPPTDPDFLICLKPFGVKHFIPKRFSHGHRKMLESFLDQLVSDKQISWAFTTLSDFDPRISIKLVEIEPYVLEFVRQLAPIIQKIDLSDLGLKTLPMDLLNPISLNLVSLNLDSNDLDQDVFRQLGSIFAAHKRQRLGTKTGTTQSVSWVRNLVDLHLNYNRLDDMFVEQSLACLTQLKRLYAKQNTISSLKGIHVLPELRVLMMDSNRLTMIHPDLFNLKKLEYAYFANNRIQQPLTGSGIRNLVHLRVIDLSNNNLITLPGSLFGLVQLEYLNASHNALSFLPNVQKSLRIKSAPIHQLNLAHNQLTTIPDGLVRIARQIDVSHNQIRSVPVGLLKWITETARSRQIKPAQLVELDLAKNPLSWPPPTVAAQGMNVMVEFYYESKIEAQTYYGLKVLFLGSPSSGKSSLCLSMLDNQPRFADRQDEVTYGLDIFNIPVDVPTLDGVVSYSPEKNQEDSPEPLNSPEDKSTNLRIWDCSGNRAYLPLINYFAYLPNVIAIMVDMSKYPFRAGQQTRYNYFCSNIAIWLDLVLTRTNHVILVLVATKIDLCSNQSVQFQPQYVNQLHSDTTNYLKEHSMWLAEQCKQIESLPQISSTTTCYYEHLQSLQDSLRVTLYTIPMCCTCSPDSSQLAPNTWDQLNQSFFRLVSRIPDLYPYVLGPLPQIWSQIEAYVEQLIEDRIYMGLMTRHQFHQLIQTRFRSVDSEIIMSITYLHNIGRVHITDMTWSKEEQTWANENVNNLVRPIPCPLVIFDLRLIFESMKFLVHPNLYKIVDQHATRLTDPVLPVSFVKNLLRWFKAATTSLAATRLEQAQQELAQGTGVVSAFLWTALVQMADFQVTGEPYSNVGRLFVEFLWRWLEIAYPVSEPDRMTELKDNSMESPDQVEGENPEENDSSRANMIDFPYHPTPAELAIASGIRSYLVASSINSLEPQLDPDDVTAPPVTPEWIDTDLVRSFISSIGLPALRFPCLILQNKPPTDRNQILWDFAVQDGPVPIIPVYRFPKGLPAGFFDRLSVRLNWPEQFEFVYTAHWKTGVQMWNPSNGILLRLTTTESTDEDPAIRFEFRALPEQFLSQAKSEQQSQQQEQPQQSVSDEVDLESKQVETISDSTNPKHQRRSKVKWHKWPVSEEQLWNLILPVLNELDGLLLAYKGLCFRRVMQCPSCHELTLSGEWLQPQEAQAVRHRKCAACGYKVASCLVAPPERGYQYKSKSRKKSRKRHRSKRHTHSEKDANE